MIYKLYVEELNESEDVVKEEQVTLLHFRGWPDCGVPNSQEALYGFH